jgi:xanthine dehydrogenase accessory factor
MAVFSGGAIAGTIGGGLVEEASIRAGVRVLETGVSEIRSFDLTGQDAASLGMVCGGEMTVLLDCFSPCDEQISFVKEILGRYEAGRKSVLATMLDEKGGVIRRDVWALGGERSSHWPEVRLPQNMRAPVVLPHEGGSLFFEPIAAVETVHFIGAGHVAQATARLAATLGFRVRVIDDRREFANTVRFPEAHEVKVVTSLGDCLPAVLDQDDYLVIMTRGHLHDRDVLAQGLRTDAGYVGMIGSRKKKRRSMSPCLAVA